MVNRRDFLSIAAAMTSWAVIPPAVTSQTRPEIAFTFDDPKTQDGANLRWQDVNERVVHALSKHKIKSVLFVCGMRVDSDAGHELIGAWDRQGHLIGNHSYSHLNFDKVTLPEFEADTLKNEPLIVSYRHFTRLFRHPYFKEGDTAEKRDGMRYFLQEHGYRLGRATIDASDWAISARLERRVKENPTADLAGYRDFFLQHIWERAQLYHSLAQRVLTRPVRHTLLLHHNALNALFVDDLIAMFVARGWRPVDAEYAYRDPVYERQPKSLPAGESLIWALAKETGNFESELRYPGEDDVYENPKMDALKL
jgi:peptidoglycan/xylan/chitin deacetylase (PgdA/CDA1 family)